MIEVKHISRDFVSPKKYPGLKGAVRSLFSAEKTVKRAVDDISFTIGDGEIVGYIGSNGAGKSTTIKMMTGILKPSAGECVVNGIDPGKERRKNAQNIGVVFGQRTQLWWDLPLSESFTILKEIYSVSDREYQERMKFLNQVLELEKFFAAPVRTLSLGQRMRADLGAALLHNPKVLFLDEPTIGLDLVVKDNIRRAIREINEKYGTTVILTTHDIGDIEELCSRILIIDGGRLIYDGSLAKLKEMYGTVRTVFLEVKEMQQVRRLNLAREFGVPSGQCRMELDPEHNICQVSFDRHRIQLPQIVSRIMEVTEVKDMRIRETELTEIVKAIYRREKGGAV